MHKSTNSFERINEKRMLSIKEAAFYTGLGTTSVRQWLDEIGAIRKIGKRILCDREVIDRAFNEMRA